MNVISALTKGTTDSSLVPSNMWAHWEKTAILNQETGFQSVSTLDILACRTVRILLFISHPVHGIYYSSWYRWRHLGILEKEGKPYIMGTTRWNLEAFLILGLEIGEPIKAIQNISGIIKVIKTYHFKVFIKESQTQVHSLTLIFHD